MFRKRSAGDDTWMVDLNSFVFFRAIDPRRCVFTCNWFQERVGTDIEDSLWSVTLERCRHHRRHKSELGSPSQTIPTNVDHYSATVQGLNKNTNRFPQHEVHVIRVKTKTATDVVVFYLIGVCSGNFQQIRIVFGVVVFYLLDVCSGNFLQIRIVFGFVVYGAGDNIFCFQTLWKVNVLGAKPSGGFSHRSIFVFFGFQYVISCVCLFSQGSLCSSTVLCPS